MVHDLTQKAKHYASHMFGWPMTLVLACAMASYYAYTYWPRAPLMSVPSIVVFDAAHGEEIFMEVERIIMGEFVADWSVVVRWRGEDGWEVSCVANGRGNYKPEFQLPDPMTLSWWTGGQCATPPPGEIFITTLWKIEARPEQPTIVVSSNVFRITD